MVVDASLLDRLRGGHSDAWCDVATAFRQQLRDLAASALPTGVACRADASDMVQLSLAEASQSFAAFRGNSLPELFDWLAAIVSHNVTDAIRQHVLAQRRTINAELRLDDSSQNRAAFDRLYTADHTPPSSAAARKESHERLSAALDRLPVRQRDAVRLRHLDGRSLPDIAIQLGCTQQAAAATIARGLRALRKALRETE
jgi:RNA polymerase sigma-70 factor (ECF subfamily)